MPTTVPTIWATWAISGCTHAEEPRPNSSTLMADIISHATIKGKRHLVILVREGRGLYDIRDGSLMNIYAKIVGTLKPIEEWVNWCVSNGPLCSTV